MDTYSSRNSSLLCSRTKSSGRPGLRSGGTSSPRAPSCLVLSAAPSVMAILSRLLSDGLLVMLSLACFSKSPKLVGGCEGNADCTISFA